MHKPELLTFFKAMADPNRLKILGLLARAPCSVEQLAAMLHLRASTVSHHLAKLAAAELVSARAESYYSVYRLETAALESLARQLLSREELDRWAADADLAAYDRKVLADFMTPDGRLKTIPAQRKKRLVVLRHIRQALQPAVRYSEAQLNQVLRQFHEDTATLRRELVGAGLMHRQGGEYWLGESEQPA